MKVTHYLLLSLFVVSTGREMVAGGSELYGDNAPIGPDASLSGEDDPPTYTIVIDPGHGGRDLGTHGEHHDEKDLALDIALELGALLAERPARDVEVIYTRTEDVFVPLYERAAIANRARADLFVSIHCNYLEQRDWHGSETYVMGLHTAERNLDVAKRENSAVRLESDGAALHYDFDPDSPMGHIILANFQHAYLERSLMAASALEENLGQRPGRRSRGVKQAGFVVLKETATPSVLVELGYLSNAGEEAYLASEAGIEQTAAALYEGLASYLRALRAQSGEGAARVTGAVRAADSDGIDADRGSARPLEPPREADFDVSFFVQLAAAAKALDTGGERWRRLGTEVRVLREANLLKYQAGPYATLQEARQAERAARALGFRGAFAVGYRGTTRLQANQLKTLR